VLNVFFKSCKTKHIGCQSRRLSRQVLLDSFLRAEVLSYKHEKTKYYRALPNRAKRINTEAVVGRNLQVIFDK
jgi:hypothetical protein